MECINFTDLNQVVNFFRGSKKIGCGREGTCYKIGNISYKLYNSEYRSIYEDKENHVRLLQFKDVMVDNFYFIKSLIYYNDKLIGSVSEYAKGICCGKIFLHRRNLDILIIALNILKKNVYELSRLGIYIDDQDLSNMVYDDHIFKLIDGGDYYYSDDIIIRGNKKIIENVDSIYRENMRKVVSMLFKSITNFYNQWDAFIFEYLSDINSPYKDYLSDIDMMLNPDETIIGIRNTIQEGIGREISSFGNCRRDLLRIRKK